MEWIESKKFPAKEGKQYLTWDGHYIRIAEILWRDSVGDHWMQGDGCTFEATFYMELPEHPKEESNTSLSGEEELHA